MKTQTTKTTKTQTTKTTKASNNTPAKTTKKAETKAVAKPHIFALVAGMVRKVEHKGMRQALKYHVAKGNLKLTAEGVALTQQGADLWTKDRVSVDPAQFQAVCSFVHNAGPAPANSRWQTGGSPVMVADKVAFPPLIHWGSFSSSMMRQAFAALWAK